MARLYDWAADILCFLVLMSLLEALLPSKKYVRYIRFFAGVVLILVAMQPLLNGLGIAQEIDRYFGEFSFQTEARDIRRDVLGIEEERRNRLLSDGEKAAAGALEAMAREEGFIPVRTEVVIEKDTEKANYGAVVRVTASVRKEDGTAAAEVREAAIRIEPVKITPFEEETAGPAGTKAAAADGLAELKRKVEDFYELEPENVEIQLEGERQ